MWSTTRTCNSISNSRFLLLTWLVKVKETGLFGQGDLLVRGSLVVEFESVIGICEVLFGLFFDFSVDFNPIQKLSAVTCVLYVSCLVSFKGFVVSAFLLLLPDKYLAR